MTERLDEADRLQFIVIQQRHTIARANAEAAVNAVAVSERDIEIARLRLVALYHMGEKDTVDLDTGEIKRAAPAAAPSAPPESADATAGAPVDIVSPAPLRAV